MLNNTKNEFIQKFGYVLHCHRKKVTNRDAIMQNLAKMKMKTGTIDSVVTYVVQTKYLSENIRTDKIIRIRAISYIAPCLRMFKSIVLLDKSPLCNIILKPDIANYKLPTIEETKLVFQVSIIIITSQNHVLVQLLPLVFSLAVLNQVGPAIFLTSSCHLMSRLPFLLLSSLGIHSVTTFVKPSKYTKF